MVQEQRPLQRAQKAEDPRLEQLSKLFGLPLNGRAGWRTSERRTSTGYVGAESLFLGLESRGILRD